VSTGTKFPGKTALHQVYFFPNLYIAFLVERLTNRWPRANPHRGAPVDEPFSTRRGSPLPPVRAQRRAAAHTAQESVAKNNETTPTRFALRPFRVDIPEEALADLRRRLAATRFADKETVADQSQGVQLATIQELARYWGTDYNWRKCEAKLNALPQFITEW
jgi:hypothetical protein